MAHICSDITKDSVADYAKRWEKAHILSHQEISRDKLALEKLFQRRLHIERREAELEESVVRSQEMKRLAANQCRQEENLAREMEKLKHADILEKKNRQLLRESSHEIRELEEKLRAAYCVKGLYAQIAEKEAQKIKDRADEMREFRQLEEARMKEADFLRHQNELEAQRKCIYMKELQEQIITSHQMKLCMYEKYLKEKKMIDDIVQRLHDEDMRELELKMEKKERTRREMEEFRKAREEWRMREREILQEEQRRIARDADWARNHDLERVAKLREKEAAKDRVRKMIMKLIEDQEAARSEREDVAFTLLTEEARYKADAEERAEIEKTLRNRIEMRMALDRQTQEKLDELQRQAQEDQSYRQQEMIRLAEQARLEQLSDALRRRKRLEHGRAVEAAIAERRRRRAEQMQELLKIQDAEKGAEQRRLRMIEEERLRILREHASRLVGFLPVGVIRPEDREMLGDLIVCPPDPSTHKRESEK